MDERERTESEIRAILSYIDPSKLNYNEWLSIGMALKNAGYSFSVWDDWSIDDEHTHERPGKWDGFAEDGTGLKMGTVIQLAKACGCPESVLFHRSASAMFEPIGFNDDLVTAGSKPVSPVSRPIRQTFRAAPTTAAEQRKIFLEALFKPGELIEYESSIRQKTGVPGKYEPADTARRRIEERDALADRTEFTNYNQPAGMWICLNPVDGKGRKIENITSWRWCLVESDEMPEDEQIRWLTESGLPIATMSTSGGRSVHAVVRIDAPDLAEYKRRTRLIFDWCDSHGFKIDKQTKNVNRLSRFPGFMRGENKQRLICWCANPKSWETWEAETQSQDDQKEAEPPVSVPLGNEYEIEPVRWLIPGAIPCGTFTLIGAAGGTGKSTLVRDIIAGMIRGQPTALEFDRILPARQPKKVMLFSAEDSYTQITLPHLKALGCTDEDLSRLAVLPNTDRRFPQIKYNSALLYQFIYSFRPDLIVFDPLQAFLPDNVDMAKRNQMRNVFADLLTRLNDETAVIIVCHFNKSQTFSGVDRIADSKDITDLARSVFLMGYTGQDDGPDKVRYLSHEKSSYARPLDTVLYKTDSRPGWPGLWFFEPLETTTKKDADFQAEKRILSSGRATDKRQTAKDYILATVTAAGIEKQQLLEDINRSCFFGHNGISERTLERITKELSDAGEIGKKTEGFAEKKQVFYYRLENGGIESE